MPRFPHIFFISILVFLFCHHAWGKGVYQTEEDFIAEAFHGSPPEATRLWLSKQQRQVANDIMGRRVPLRIKHWYQGNRSAWILEEVGKEKAITTGIIVEQGKIVKLKVLIFRESRGWEVRYPFFSNQFNEVGLKQDSYQLDKGIDGISGATLSVRALKKLARLSLYLHAVLVNSADD